MTIPDAIKENFHALGKAFKNGDIALLECRERSNGEPAYVVCAINLHRQADREPEIEMVPLSYTEPGRGARRVSPERIIF